MFMIQLANILQRYCPHKPNVTIRGRFPRVFINLNITLLLNVNQNKSNDPLDTLVYRVFSWYSFIPVVSYSRSVDTVYHNYLVVIVEGYQTQDDPTRKRL